MVEPGLSASGEWIWESRIQRAAAPVDCAGLLPRYTEPGILTAIHLPPLRPVDPGMIPGTRQERSPCGVARSPRPQPRAELGWHHEPALALVPFTGRGFFVLPLTVTSRREDAMIQAALMKLMERQSLAQDEAEVVMSEIMQGQTTPTLIAAFLVALRLKGETEEEMAGFVTVMRAHAVPVVGPAGAGAYVAKHGNRAMSGRCGSADVLEALGVNIQLGPAEVARTLAESHLGFMFATNYHPAMRYAGPVRRELGVRTVFNLLGPLTNPAGAEAQVLGVA